ncbi:MAG TPA: sugar transferase [Gemmatimonadaceae bacterium]|nr:sugar transferase [Gemmatimonadaceae bacterium]
MREIASEIRGTSDIAAPARRRSEPLRPDSERPIAIVREPRAGVELAEVSRAVVAAHAPTHSDRVARILSMLIACVALALLSPIMLLVAVVIRLSSPGPVLYAQARVGVNRRRSNAGPFAYDRRACDLGGRVFRIYKFRTMRIDAERRGVQWATKNDPRVTALGRFLRQSRLDELPQLFNVVRGDMNIVGPRPERPSIVRRLAASIEEYPLRLWIRPGITGLAQINQSYDTCLEDVRSKVRYDLDYIRRRSVREDLRIMLCTMPAMLFRRGGW